MGSQPLYSGKEQINYYRSILEKYRFRIYKASSIEEQKKIMQEVYQFMKEISLKTYHPQKGFNKIYRLLVQWIPSLEENISKKYILDVKPNFDYTKANEKRLTLTGEKSEDKVQFMVDTIRTTLYHQLNKKRGLQEQPLEALDLEGYCSAAADMASQIGEAMHVKTTKVTIEPGFISNSPLFNHRKKHWCSFVKMGEELYLVDCTYSQFFLEKDCMLERLGVPLLSGCSVGAFMMMTEFRKQVANKLLKDGWIKVIPEVLKAYMDGFALSYRNGLYYEDTTDFSFTTPYTAEDYIRFLFQEDNQLQYEEEQHLGLQSKPLANIHTDFLPNHFKIAK